MKKIYATIIGVLFISLFSDAQDSINKITLEDIWLNYKFYPKSVRGIQSMNNGEQYTMIKNNAIVVYDYKTGDSVSTLVDGNQLMPEGEEESIRISSFVMSADGKNVRRLTKEGYNTDPSWSPNPRVNKIAFVRVEKGGVNIFTISPDGSGEQRLTWSSRRNENPAWTPDGHYISFVSNRSGSNNIYLMFHNGQNQIQLSRGAAKTFPTWCG